MASALWPARFGPSKLGLRTSASGRRNGQGGGRGAEGQVEGPREFWPLALPEGSGVEEGWEGEWCALPHTSVPWGP